MRFQFIRLFFEAAAAEGAGGGSNNQQQQQSNDNADAKALLEKFTALEIKNTELEKKIAELLKPKEGDQNQQQQNNNQQQQDNKGKDAEVPAWAKELVESNKKQAELLATLQTEKTVSVRKTLLETELKAIEGLPDSYRDEVIDNFSGRTFENDAAFETFKKAKVEAAKKLAQTESANSISIFSAPKVSTGADSNKMSTAMQNYLKSKQPATPSKN